MTKLTRGEIVARILVIRDQVPDDTEPRWALLALADEINDPRAIDEIEREKDVDAVRRGAMTVNRARERAGFPTAIRKQPSYWEVRNRIYRLAIDFPRSEMELREDLRDLAAEMATPIRGPYDLPTGDPTPDNPMTAPDPVTLTGTGSFNQTPGVVRNGYGKYRVGQEVGILSDDFDFDTRQGTITYYGPVIAKMNWDSERGGEWRYVVKGNDRHILRESELVPVTLVQS